MKTLIKKILRESFNQLKFNKIDVELFYNGSSITTNYETGSYGGGDYSTPKDKRIKIRITPIIDLTHIYDRNKSTYVTKHGEEYDNFLDYDNGIDLSGLFSFTNDSNPNTVILCQEGILLYQSKSDADCDGSSYSFEGKFISHNKISEWEKIKEFIKPRLKQSDINDAIRTIGKEKEFCKITNYTGIHREANECEYLKKLKKENKIDSFSPLDGRCDTKTAIKINGKYGIGYVRNNELTTLIPYIYDNYEYEEEKRQISMIKGGVTYVYGNKNGKWVVVDKFEIKEKRREAYEKIKQLEDLYQKDVENNNYDGRLYAWLRDNGLYDVYSKLLG